MAFGDISGAYQANAASITNPFSLPLVSGSNSVVVGDLVVAVLAEQTSLTVTGAFDNLGNTYTAVNAGTDVGTLTGRAFYSRVTVAGNLTTASFTCTGSTDNCVGIAGIIDGPFSTSILDAQPANSTTDVTTPFVCPSSGTLATTVEVVVGWAVLNGNNAATATAPDVVIATANTASILTLAVSSRLVSATTAVTPTFNGANGTTVLGTISFKGIFVPSQPRPLSNAVPFQPLIAQ